jgi:thiaminase/transcriptional activator TenA
MSSNFGSPLFAALRARSRWWDVYVSHPFVMGLGDGSASRDGFLNYLRQDYVFLIHFSRAWAYAAAKTDRVAELRAAIGVADALINHELQLHVGVCAAAGIDEAALEATEEAAENLAYTRFVLDQGLKGDFLDLLAALAPCVLGYGEIGARLLAETEGRRIGHPFAAWIETYGGPDYQGVCADFARLLEGASAARLGPDPALSPRWPGLVGAFDTAARLEAGFWTLGQSSAAKGG